jgi:hypothetical protein
MAQWRRGGRGGAEPSTTAAATPWGYQGVRRGLSALDLDASSAAVAAAHTLCRTRRREGARSDGDPGNGGCGGGFGV